MLLKKLKKLGAYAHSQNQGAAIISVLVAMAFISILGATLLYMSYTAVLMRSTEQKGIATFYDAAAVMDQVLAGFQQVSSDSIAVAYQQVLINYAHTPSHQTAFHDNFVQALLAWQNQDDLQLAKEVSSALDENLYSLNLAVIADFLIEAGIAKGDIAYTGLDDAPENASIMISGGENIIAYPGDKVVFKDIVINYHNPQTNYSTMVSSDISLKMPDFIPAAGGMVNFSDIPNFSIIADNVLQTQAQSSALSGNIYAGSLNLSGSGATTTFDGGQLISPGPINIATNHDFIVPNNAEIWAHDLILANQAQFNLSGKAYIANDLSLSGDNSQAELSGEYYGFGLSAELAAESSSILANGQNINLDLANSQILMLAGHSFVVPGSIDANVLMGESIASRPSQLAYLVPNELLLVNDTPIVSNPLLVAADQTIEVQTADQPLWLVNGTPRTVDDYGRVQLLRYNLPGSQAQGDVYYYFFDFYSMASANEYFRHYFSNNLDTITNYLDGYGYNMTDIGGMVAVAGHYLYNSNGSYALSPIPEGIEQDDALRLADMYARLNSTLSATAAETTGKPYDYIVDSLAVSNFISDNPNADGVWEFKDGSGDTLAILTNRNYRLDINSPDSLRFVLAINANITVDRNYQGILIAGANSEANGNITVQAAELDANSSGVQAALYATYGLDDSNFASLLKLGDADNDNTLIDASQAESWLLSDLVIYENWQKN